MPEVARFLGLTIYMYFYDHAPPHLHAEYGRARVMMRLSDGVLLRGELPKTALRLLRDWMVDHRADLEENWRRAQMGERLERIPGPDGRE
jgi:hypothetical protein